MAYFRIGTGGSGVPSSVLNVESPSIWITTGYCPFLVLGAKSLKIKVNSGTATMFAPNKTTNLANITTSYTTVDVSAYDYYVYIYGSSVGQLVTITILS